MNIKKNVEELMGMNIPPDLLATTRELVNEDLAHKSQEEITAYFMGMKRVADLTAKSLTKPHEAQLLLAVLRAVAERLA